MSEPLFSDRPHLPLLVWLARGSLKQHLLPSIRLWVWLRLLYGEHWERLPLASCFSFAQWRNVFFSATHPPGETAPVLHDASCACAKTTADWIFTLAADSELEWRQAIQRRTGLSTSRLDELLGCRLFAVTRRALAADLKVLAELGWLGTEGRFYQRVSRPPTYPQAEGPAPVQMELRSQDLALLNLDLAEAVRSFALPIAGVQRFFLAVDYIVSSANQDRVEDWQDQLRQLWQETPVPPIQLAYQSAQWGYSECVVYPVCIYYVQRAVYLCGFGQTPAPQGKWYNYRLDRIGKLRGLSWQDLEIPQWLVQDFRQGSLPAPGYIEQEMVRVWGFDFYLPAQLMLVRFEREFHDHYVLGSQRHDTFKKVSYRQARRFIEQSMTSMPEKQRLLAILEARSPEDAYYQVWYRQGDPNVGLRLRAWRPNVEVFLPGSLRQQVAREVELEAKLYEG